MSYRPLIALADPEWIGHRETYFKEFVLSLHRAGADVAALCPDPDKIRALVQDTGSPGGLSAARLNEPSRPSFFQRLPHDPVTTFRRWRLTSAALHMAEQEAGRPADLLFLPWLDSYLRASVHEGTYLKGIHCRWAGLYFRPYHLLQGESTNPIKRVIKGDDLLKSSRCHSVSILDETVQPVLQKLSGKPVLLFPDITNEAAPQKDVPLVQQIQQAAAGRKIIGLIGLERRKGVITLLKAADRARESGAPWLFVLSGSLRLNEFTEEERQLFQTHFDRAKRQEPGNNVFFPEELKPIPDGPAFNGVMDTFDILFTAYQDFLGSSNVLTKAAILQKPVISTDNGCIGWRTKAYDLGLTIPQGDDKACCDAITLVLSGKRWDGAALQPRFAEYHALHNRAKLDQTMQSLVQSV